MTVNHIDAEATAIARRYRQLGEAIAAAQEEQAALRSRFAALTPVGYSLVVDGKAVSKAAPARRFDATMAELVARKIGLPVRYTEVLDSADLKRRLEAINRLDWAMVPGAGAEIVRLA